MKFFRTACMFLIPGLVRGIAACSAQQPVKEVDYCIVLHGGAHTEENRFAGPEEAECRKSLARALEIGRKVLAENGTALDKLATGEIFTASKAQEYGLVDRIGFMEDAIQRAAELAGVDDQHVRVVRYRSPAKLLDIPFLSESGNGDPISRVFELSSPRAFYISSTMPPLITSRSSVRPW